MEPNQISSKNQVILSDDLGQQKDETINPNFIAQFSIRTMAKDLETLAKKTSQGNVSLFTKPAPAGAAPPPEPPVPPRPSIISVTPQAIRATVPTPQTTKPISQTTNPAEPPQDLPIPRTLPPAPLPQAPLTPKPITPMPQATLLPNIVPHKPTPPATHPKKSLFKKLNTKKILIIGLPVVGVFILGLGSWAIWRNLKPSPAATPSPSLSQSPSNSPIASATPTPQVFPQPPFTMDKQEIIPVNPDKKIPLSEVLQSLALSSATSSFTQIAFRTKDDTGQNRLLNFNEFTSFFNLTSFGPATAVVLPTSTAATDKTTYLQDLLDQTQYFPFIYFQAQDGNSPFSGGLSPGRVGLIGKLKDTTKEDAARNILKNLEPTMPEELKDLLVFANSTVEVPNAPKFIDNTYKNSTIRYMNFPFSTLSLDYALVNGYLLLTTSKEAMYAAIDRLLETAATSTKGNLASDESDWQTYQNDKYGFEIKYPADYKETKTDAIVDFEQSNNQKSTYMTYFRISAMLNDSNLCNAADYTLKLTTDSTSTIKRNEIKLTDDISAWEMIYPVSVPDTAHRLIYLSRKDCTPPVKNEIFFFTAGGDILHTFDSDTINQILSTFKFTQ